MRLPPNVPRYNDTRERVTRRCLRELCESAELPPQFTPRISAGVYIHVSKAACEHPSVDDSSNFARLGCINNTASALFIRRWGASETAKVLAPEIPRTA